MPAHSRSTRYAPRAVPGLAASLLASLVLAAPAGAIIHPDSVLAGPSNTIVEVDGAAMAPDGSGGVLYRAQVGGVAHLFAIPFAGGRWGSPTEVDTEDLYGASQPAIAAGDGGRLLVVWVQPRNISSKGVTLYELQSASLQSGADSFGQAITVDPNIGEPYTGNVGAVEPRLAMAPDGIAYVAYRVIADECALGGPDNQNPRSSECPSDRNDELLEVRVARYAYLLWSALGAVNRAPQVAMRNPTPANAPSLGIGVEGNGVIAWQEPDAEGFARIWVRRLFGTTQGAVLAASPTTLGGRPVASDAEAEAVAVGRYGEAKIAFRIDGRPGSAVTTTQLYLNSLPSTFDPRGAQLEGPRAIPGAAAPDLGVPSGALDPTGGFRVAWSQAGGVWLVSGNARATGAPATIGSSAGPAQTTINPAGGGTTAWSSSAGGPPAVAVREDYPAGAYQAARLAGEVPGPVSGLSLAGSGAGDALIAWMQGPPGRSEVVGDFVQAPPAQFIVSVPHGWVHARQATITWEPSTDAVPGVTYTVYVDGRPLARDLTVTYARLSLAALGDGVHEVQVLAGDAAGGQTMSAKAALSVDVNPPIVRVRLIRGRTGVRVSVSDDASGIDAGATQISFGDGARSDGHARARHVYGRPGLYTITARVRDRVGNQATVHIRVRVR